METTLLDISVGAMPDGSEDLSIRGELEIIKPALLYGDTTTLYSPHILMLYHLDKQGSFTPEELSYFTRAYSKSREPLPGEREMNEVLESLEELRNNPNRSPEDETRLRALASFKEAMHQGYHQELRPQIEKFLKDTGYREIRKAVNEGLLTITPLVRDEILLRSERGDKLIHNFIDNIEQIMKKPGTYPLFDAFSLEVVQALVEDGRLSKSVISLSHAKQVGVASQLMRYAPTFPKADIYDIIDIRKDLRKPLVRFRSGTLRLGELVESPIYGEEFETEVRDLIIQEIDPAILEIEEEIQNNKSLRRLTREAFNHAGTLVSSGLSVGIAPVADLPALWSIAATTVSGVALFGKSIQILADVYTAKQQVENEIKGREMFLLVGMNQELEKRARRRK